MELNFVLLLSAIIQSTMVIERVQGYSFTNSNSTQISSGKYQPIYNNELIARGRQNKRHHRENFDEVLRHYSASENKREPRFVSFNTKDDQIEVEIDFAIPFLSIPVKRSLSGAMGTIQNVISGIPTANVNIGALLLTGIVIAGGAMIGGIGRLFNGGSYKNSEDEGSFDWMHILEEIDKALLKYDLDTTACAQRAICWYVKNSMTNIEESRASSFDHLVKLLSGSDWVHNMLSNTAWNSAIVAGKRRKNCEMTYSTCSLSPENLENFSDNLKQIARLK